MDVDNQFKPCGTIALKWTLHPWVRVCNLLSTHSTLQYIFSQLDPAPTKAGPTKESEISELKHQVMISLAQCQMYDYGNE